MLRLLQRATIGARQVVFFHHQPQAAGIQLLDVALQIGMLRFSQLQLLLQQQLFALQFVVALLRDARGIFRLRQVPPFQLSELLRLAHLGAGPILLALPVFQQRMHALALVLLLFDLLLCIGELLRHALALLGDVLDVLLQPRDLGIRRVQIALLDVQCVGKLVMPAARGFQLAFNLAQARGFAFEFGARLLGALRESAALRFSLLFLDQPEQTLRGVALRFQRAVLLRHLGLRAQMHQLFFQLLQNVADAQQIVARVADTQFRFAAAVAVFGNARGFLEKDAQLLGFGLDDARDHALLDYGVGASTQPGAEEYVGDVLAPHVLVVDVVTGIAVALQHALDGDFRIAGPLPVRLAQRIVEDQFDARARHRLALAGTVEDHVLHGLAAQRGSLGLAQHPAQRVDHVRLAAAVRPDHAHDLPRQRNVRGIDEGFETGQFYMGKTQFGCHNVL